LAYIIKIGILLIPIRVHLLCFRNQYIVNLLTRAPRSCQSHHTISSDAPTSSQQILKQSYF
jgi:hypothetical protein